MKRFYTRKIILLSSIFILLIIFLLQLYLGRKTDVKIIYTDSEIDFVEITKNNLPVLALKQDGEIWTSDGFSVLKNRANGIVNSINEIKILGTATKRTDDLARYGLTEESALKVSASSEGKIVRTLFVGKNSTAGNQCYIMLDSDKTVYLAQGDLRDTFEVSVDDIKENPPEPSATEE